MRTITWGLTLAVCMTTSTAVGEGGVESGDALFEWVNFGDLFGDFTPTAAGITTWRTATANGPSHLAQHWFYFRVFDDEAEMAFPPPTFEQYDSSDSRGEATQQSSFEIRWEEAVGLPVDARLEGTMTDTGVNQSTLIETLTIINTSDAPIDLELFTYVDFDIGLDFGGQPDTAMLIEDGYIRVDDHGTFDFGEVRAPTSDAYQVQAFPNLRNFNLLNCCPNDLNNTGLPFGPGNFTGAFQWHLTLAPGATRSIPITMAINTTAPDPVTTGDLTGDGQVNVMDLLVLLGAWGPCDDCPADLDGDGNVSVTDLLTLLANWTN